MESLLEKIDTYHNNPEKSSTTKKISIKPLVIYCLHIVHLMLQKISLVIIETKTEKNSHICRKEFSTDDSNKTAFKKYHKVRDHCHYTGKYSGAVHNIFNLRYKTPKEVPAVFHNGSKYEYHFIIKELAEEFEGQFECQAHYQIL